MKLLVLWLFGTPLAVGAICAAAAFKPRTVAPVAVSASAVSSVVGQPHVQHVLPTIRQ